jgi:hypothetical protein
MYLYVVNVSLNKSDRSAQLAVSNEWCKKNTRDLGQRAGKQAFGKQRSRALSASASDPLRAAHASSPLRPHKPRFQG